MFFIGIFGIEQKEKEIKKFGSVVCPDCGRLTNAVLFVSYTYFHTFFIPTFRWNKKYFLKLRCCGSVYEAPEEYARLLKDADTIDMSRLRKVHSGFGGNDMFTVCPACGRTFDKSFSYCPYCGAKR